MVFKMEFSREVIVDEVKTAFVTEKDEIKQEIYNFKKKKELLLIAYRYQDIFDNEDVLNDIKYFEIIGITKDEVEHMQQTINVIDANISLLNKRLIHVNDLIEELI